MTSESSAQAPIIHVYGPVPSRRLGFSLGVDILPFKTCTLDCIYCQLGSYPGKSVRRRSHFSLEEILPSIRRVVESGRRIDYITFSGSGEPTLNTLIGPLIREIKGFTKIPVAILTNGTLLSRPGVRRALRAADLVIPSLDAVTPDLFERINRPHSSLKVEDVIQGIVTFRREFRGRLWLEVMLIKDINDGPEHLAALKRVIAEIAPDRIQLNTVVRPPAESFARPLSPEAMVRIREFLGERAEVIATFDRTQDSLPETGLKDTILAVVQRRPVTLDDLSQSLGRHGNELIKYLNMLLEEGRIRTVSHADRTYYEPD